MKTDILLCNRKSSLQCKFSDKVSLSSGGLKRHVKKGTHL